jgi:ElaB/YqjD/DUF883 family membrane-anchored ribosome-binding protein
MNPETTNAVSENAVQSTTETVNQLAGRVQETVRQTQARLNEMQREMVHRSKAAAQSTDTYVRQNPWNAALAACAFGFVLGLIAGRR